jgi:hypothetical protein
MVTDSARPERDLVNKIFGDSLPEITRDESDERPSDGEAERDHWLRENVPPHHG